MAKKDRTVKIEDVFDQLVGAPEVGSSVVVINDKRTYTGWLEKYGKQDGKVKKAYIVRHTVLGNVGEWESIHDVFTIEQ
jgi:hypothetical protein